MSTKSKQQPLPLSPPRSLKRPEAVARWQQKSDVLVAAGYGQEILDLLEHYCIAYQDWLDGSEKVTESGVLMRDNKGGIIESPWVKFRDSGAKRMQQLGKELPFTGDGSATSQGLTLQDYTATLFGDNEGMPFLPEGGAGLA